MNDENNNGTAAEKPADPAPAPEQPVNATEPPSQAPTLPAPPMSDEVKAFVPYFGRPVALQLNTPYVVTDALGKTQIGNRTCGVAGPVSDKDGNCIPQSVVMGMINPTADGARLLVRLQSPDTGAVVEIMLSPKDVQYISVIVALPPEPSLIVRPGAN